MAFMGHKNACIHTWESSREIGARKSVDDYTSVAPSATAKNAGPHIPAASRNDDAPLVADEVALGEAASDNPEEFEADGVASMPADEDPQGIGPTEAKPPTPAFDDPADCVVL
jgi:pyocin large subunit-like protein